MDLCKRRLTRSADNKEADGSATTEGAAEKQEEVKRRNGEVKDAGVQTDDLQALVNERDS